MAARYMGLKEFATHMGKAPSYVSKLKHAGRLALTKDGRVKVAESIALIEATRGTRDDVAARNAEQRQNKKQEGDGALPIPEEKNAPAPQGEVFIPGQMTLKEAQSLKARSEARRVAAVADREEMERDRMAGDLIAREDVDAAMRFIGATVRALLDVFPDQVAPIVAPCTDMNEVHALLAEQCRSVLVGLGEAIERQKNTLNGAENGN